MSSYNQCKDCVYSIGSPDTQQHSCSIFAAITYYSDTSECDNFKQKKKPTFPEPPSETRAGITTPEQFNEILEKRILSIKSILGNKAKEYAMGGDRLHNFKVAARVKNESPEKALWGMAIKHLVCIIDMVDGELEATAPMVDEKIGDMINYLILLEALMKEGK